VSNVGKSLDRIVREYELLRECKKYLKACDNAEAMSKSPTKEVVPMVRAIVSRLDKARNR